MSTTIPTFTQTADLFLNIRGPQYPCQFFLSRQSSLSRAYTPQFVVGDAVLLRLWLCSENIAAGVRPNTHYTNGPIAFAIKPAGATTATGLLAFIGDSQGTGFTAVEDDNGIHYEGALNLATDELLSHFASGATQISARLDIELQSQGNATRMTFATSIQIVAQVYQGTEVSPVPAQPTYPPPGDIPSLIQVQTLIAQGVADAATAGATAAQTQLQGMVNTAVATAIATVPRVATATAANLPAGAAATAVTYPSPIFDDDGNQIDTDPVNLTLALGIPSGMPGAVTSVPAEFIRGSIPLPPGLTQFVVAFSPAFSATPIITASIAAPAPNSPDLYCSIAAAAPDSFTAKLSATSPGAGYTLNYIAVAAQ